MVIATVSTAHFEFVAVGRLYANADAALREGWMEHCNQYPEADRGLMDRRIAEGEVNYLDISEGQCARDGSVISP